VLKACFLFSPLPFWGRTLLTVSTQKFGGPSAAPTSSLLPSFDGAISACFWRQRSDPFFFFLSTFFLLLLGGIRDIFSLGQRRRGFSFPVPRVFSASSLLDAYFISDPSSGRWSLSLRMWAPEKQAENLFPRFFCVVRLPFSFFTEITVVTPDMDFNDHFELPFYLTGAFSFLSVWDTVSFTQGLDVDSPVLRFSQRIAGPQYFSPTPPFLFLLAGIAPSFFFRRTPNAFSERWALVFFNKGERGGPPSGL